MKPENNRTGSDRTPSTPPAPKRRFRIQKLEQRIAPKRGGKGSHNCNTGLCDTDSGTGTSGY